MEDYLISREQLKEIIKKLKKFNKNLDEITKHINYVKQVKNYEFKKFDEINKMLNIVVFYDSIIEENHF